MRFLLGTILRNLSTLRKRQIRSYFLVTASPITGTVSGLRLGLVLRTRVRPLSRTVGAILMQRLVQLVRHSRDKQVRRTITTRQAGVLAARETERRRRSRVESLFFVRL